MNQDEELIRAIQLYKIYTAFKRYCKEIQDDNMYRLAFHTDECGEVFYKDPDDHDNEAVIAEWSTLEEGVEATADLHWML